MSPKARLIIIGTGGHARSVFGLASDAGYKIEYFLDETDSFKDFLGIKVAGKLFDIPNFEDYSFVIAIGDNNLRRSIYNKISEFLPVTSFPSIIHKNGFVGINSQIGFGTLIFPFTNVGPFTEVGDFCILNTGSILEHDSRIASFSSLAPNATVGGNVHIGSGTWIGLNASIKQGVQIGNDSVVGAQSFVKQNIESNVVAYGAPAKVIRTRLSDEKFL